MEIKRATVVVGVFLGLHLAPVWWHSVPVWGGDFLVYYPRWVLALFGFLSILILMPSVREGVIRGVRAVPDAIDPWGSRRSFILFSLLLVVSGGAAFVGLRSAVHLLGDGYLYIRELDTAVWQTTPRADRAPLAFWIIRNLYRFVDPVRHSAELAYRIYSYTSGVLYLLLALSVAYVLGRDRLERSIVLGFLLTAGSMQLFFGYVENYALLFPGILLYLLTGLLTLRRRCALWAPAVALGALVPLHFAMATFVPSLLALAFLMVRLERREGRTWWRVIVRNSAYLCLSPVVTGCIFTCIDFDLSAFLAQMRGSHLLPLFGLPGFAQPYRMLSLAHFLDVLCQYFLVAPSAVVVLCLLPGGRIPRDADHLFLFTATLFPVLFTLVANPEIGAFRDWDTFSFPALPFTLWAAFALVRCFPERCELAHVGLMICGAAGLHTLLWIGVNARDISGEARFSHILEQGRLSAHARFYGWETLGLHYRARSQEEKALWAYLQALRANPWNARLWCSTGNIYRELGRTEDAVRSYRRSIEIDARFAEAYSNLGNVYFGLGRLEEAAQNYRKAIDAKPEFADAHYNLGVAHYHLGEYEKAIAQCQKALSVESDFLNAYYSLGMIFSELGQYEDAVQQYQNVVRLVPERADVHQYLGRAYYHLGHYEQAIGHYRKAISLKSDYADAHYNLGAVFLSLRQYERAIESYQNAMRFNSDIQAHFYLGVAYYNLKQYKTAIGYLENAISLNGRKTDAYHILGSACLQLNQIQKARDCFRKVLELQPDSPLASELTAWLQRNP